MVLNALLECKEFYLKSLILLMTFEWEPSCYDTASASG